MTLTTYEYPMVLAVVLLFSEATVPFTTLRFLLKKHGVKDSHPMQAFNSGMIYLTFLGSRVIFQPICMIMSMGPYAVKLVKEGYSPGYIFMCSIMAFCVFVFFALNVFWFYMINRIAMKLFLPQRKDREPLKDNQDT